MKMALAFATTLSAYCLTHAQIQVGVWTDKPSYVYGDTIAITVTAYNPGADTVILNFTSACQVSYTIDQLNLKDSLLCATVTTSATVSPFSTRQWDLLRYPWANAGWPKLATGSHAITGEVLGYGRSDTLIIFVSTATSVYDQRANKSTFLLNQNFPNPFNGETIIPYTLSEAGTVRIELFNALGQPVRTLLDVYRSAGSYALRAQLHGLPSGSYWCRLQMGGKSQTIKIVLAK